MRDRSSVVALDELVPFETEGHALARAGRREEALARIREATTLEARFLELSQADDDLASLRADPSFPRP